MIQIITSESVNCGHPDKTCDTIADAFLDEALRQDPNAMMAIECAIKNNKLFIYGECTTTAKIEYELIAKNMGLEKFPKLNVSHEINGDIDGHAGKEITIYLDNAIRMYGKDDAKSNIIDILRHELEHYKQDIIIFLQKGDKNYETAFTEQKRDYIAQKAAFRGVSIKDILNEEAAKYDYNPRNQVGNVEELYKIMFEHDTPIQTIRTMTPCDFEKLHLTPEELAKADEYLESIRSYMTQDRFPENFFLPDGKFNIQEIDNSGLLRLFTELQDSYLGTGYVNNPLEVGARKVGESLRDKFRVFLDAIK